MKARIPLRNKFTKRTQEDMIALAEQELSKKQLALHVDFSKLFVTALTVTSALAKSDLNF